MTFEENWDREITNENVWDVMKCPTCKEDLEIHPGAAWCPDCAFEIARNVETETGGGVYLSIWAVAALLRNEQNVLIENGLYARLCRKGNVWTVELHSDIKCPLCGGVVEDRGTLIACENNERAGGGCEFRVWRTALARNGCLKLSNEQIKTLIAGRMIYLELSCARGCWTKYYVRLVITWEGPRVRVLDNDYTKYPERTWPDPVPL